MSPFAVFCVVAVLALVWGAVLLCWPRQLSAFARKTQGETMGQFVRPELVRFIGGGFTLFAVIFFATTIVSAVRG